MDRPPALILAGGKATRMGGGDKPLLMLGGKPLLAHIIGRLDGQAAPLALSSNGDVARFDGFGLPILPDLISGQLGPMAGIHAGLTWAKAMGADRLLTTSGDTPFLPSDLAVQLASEAQNQVALVQSGGKVHPTIGFWPVSTLEPMATALHEGQRALYHFAQLHGCATVEWPLASVDPFFNINTPDDLHTAETLLRHM